MARRENAIPSGIPKERAELAQVLRTLRREADKTLRALSESTHYSVATLSTAASGKSLPRWEVVEAYANACGAENRLAELQRLWSNAHSARKSPTAPQRKTVPTPAVLDAPVGNVARSTGSRPATTSLTLESRRRFRSGPRSRASETTGNTPLPTLSKLVQEVTTRENPGSKATVDLVRTSLSLCTTPPDFIAVMKEVHLRSGLSLREISTSMGSPPAGYRASKSALHEVLHGARMPSTEMLHAFLVACGSPPEHWGMWHHTLTRVKIAQLLQPNTQDVASSFRNLFRERMVRQALLVLILLTGLLVQLMVVVLNKG